MKKIALDLRCLESPTSKRGIGYFTKSLFEHLLLKPHPQFCFNLVTFPKSKLTKNLTIGPKDKFISIPAIYWPKKGLRRLDPIFSFIWSKLLKRVNPDLIHITSLFEVYYLDIPDNIPSLVTLYDTIPLIFPKSYFQNQKAKDWYIQRLNQAKKASKIITISKSSKKDIAKILKVPSEKITVIYPGVDERFKPIGKSVTANILKKYKITTPYILTVSTPSFHKNTLSIFQAFKDYINSKDTLSLVVVCKLIAKEEKSWQNEIRRLGLDKKVLLTNFVSDQDLPAIYSGAEVLLFPSLYEGLGLPVLEAFASGIPVITSYVSSLPEVGGEAVLYVNPNKVSDIKRSIKQILDNKNLKQVLIERGFSQVKKFSWDQAATKTLQVYSEVLNSHEYYPK